MAERGRRLVPTLLGVGALAALALYLFGQRSHIADSWALDPRAAAGIAVAVAATLALRAVANLRFYGALGVRASYRDWLGLVAVTAYTNYLPLSAGVFAKALFLKRVHALSYRHYAAGQAGLMLLTLATNGIAGLAVLGLVMDDGLVGPVGAGLALMVLAIVPLLLPKRFAVARLERFLPWEIHASPQLRRAWPAVAAVQVGVILLTALSLHFAFAMGENRVGYAACVLFSASFVLTRLVAVTPGALGIREFLVGGLAYLTGFELRDAVIASTLMRTVEIAVVCLLGALFTWGLSRQLAATWEEQPGDPSDPPTG